MELNLTHEVYLARIAYQSVIFLIRVIRSNIVEIANVMKLTSFDLFAGAGGLSLGFKLGGITPVYAVEQDKWAAETYAKNNPDVKIDVRDIREISDDEVALLISHGSPDIIIGGPPCQGFSHANTGNKDPKDPRNSLFIEFIRFAKIIKPALCVIENVPGLLRTKLANGLYAIDAIKDAFKEIGYSSEWKILNAVDFGVPQKRERLFILAKRNNILSDDFVWPIATHGKSITQQQLWEDDSNSPKPYVSLWDAISDLPQIYASDSLDCLTYSTEPSNAYQELMRNSAGVITNHEPMRHTSRVMERFMSIGLGQSEADVPDHLRPRRRNGGGEFSATVYDQNSRRQYPDLPCNAMVASSHTNFVHPYLHRNFTVREMMRIQSFPDNFIVCGKRAVLSKKLSIKKGYADDIYLDQRAQVGNAVPPLLARSIACSVRELFLKSYREKLNAA